MLMMVVFLCVECLFKIADREISRRKEIETQLDFISRQLGQLQIITALPATTVPSHTLVNSAMDVRSAVMGYLAVQIRHESIALGIVGRHSQRFRVEYLGKVVTTFTAGDDERNGVNAALESAVRDFNAALSHYGHGVGFKTFETVEGVTTALIWLTCRNSKKRGETSKRTDLI